MSCERKPDVFALPGYRLIEPLGSGGFGEVWKCEAPGGLFKAIKFVYGNLETFDLETARAEQELAALQCVKEVRHPFVLSLDRIEIVKGELLIVMELADKSLHDSFVEYQSSGLVGIPRDALLRYVRDAAEALDHMNEKHNLQHLDIKPRNLFLISDRVKVADFGLVKQIERTGNDGMAGGVTPLYAAPETFNGKISPQSDQYSLAIVYLELLTGRRPFNGKSVRELAQQHLYDEPELRSLPEMERPVLARALAKDPSKRFANCLAFVRALYAAQGRIRPVRPPEENGAAAHGGKTLAQTLEDISLEEEVEQVFAERKTKTSISIDLEEVSRLGITMAQPQSGALRPSIIIGLGTFGRLALQELRCRFIDRFGDLSKAPIIRFLYVDSDGEAIQQSVRGSSETALPRNETYHLPIQAAGRYRRRSLDQLSDWLPREKLHSIPRSLQAQGSRALGRLAFVDNHLRFLARLRREVQSATHADALYQTVSQTGLALRDSIPRVYILAGASGSCSGFLIDLAFGLRRLLTQLRHETADIHLLLSCGAVEDPATPATELANTYATLTELNHFADPTIPFVAQYAADTPRMVEQGSGFSSIYLLPQAQRTSGALRDQVAHTCSYLFHDLTTPLGLHLDRARSRKGPADSFVFRSFGTYAVWYPRGLLLRLAARQSCRELVEEWCSPGPPNSVQEIEAACARILADSELQPEMLTARIDDAARPAFGVLPADALTRLLCTLEEQAQLHVALDDPGNWAKQAAGRLREWVGAAPPLDLEDSGQSLVDAEWRKSQLHKALTVAAQSLATEWDQRLAKVAFGLMEHPGKKVAAAEEAFLRFKRFCKEALAMYKVRREQQALRAQQSQAKLDVALQHCLNDTRPAGWSLSSLLLLGNSSRRSLRLFMDHMATFARQCLAAELAGSGQLFFTLLSTKIEDRLRELQFCRQRLRTVADHLGSAQEHINDLANAVSGSGIRAMHWALSSTECFWDSIRHSSTVRVILPDGDRDLGTAAARFASTLTQVQRAQLDQALQDGVLGPQRGLQTACAGAGDLARSLALPLVDVAASYSGDLLPITDVADVEFSRLGSEPEKLTAEIEKYLSRAEPLLQSISSAQREDTFLLIPASEPGTALSEIVQQVAPRATVVRVPGQAHLMICREQGKLNLDDVQALMNPCRKAYEEASIMPQVSPHSRFDIIDWLPLDP
ncbi:MAG TPA: tubulin-like doman-containing protein [Gemmataceae bacterium]|jgi:serine/threonine protein kinase|nr:tubulin-like doman-containing protein [Gemmataceae bacterium]